MGDVAINISMDEKYPYYELSEVDNPSKYSVYFLRIPEEEYVKLVELQEKAEEFQDKLEELYIMLNN